MISDNERREVARRLRENAEVHPNTSLILNLAFADDSLRPDGSMEWKVTSHDAAMRLADLIEPSCDRAVLLALADELEENACWEVQSPGVDNCAWRIKDVCDRIRESLGVQDGN